MKKKIKKIIRTLLWTLLTILGILSLYILFNLNLFHKTKPLTTEELGKLTTAIKPDSSDPYQFIAGKFDTHSVVFLGELHKRKQDLAFFSKLIPYLYLKKNITIIGWEFGAAEFQRDADSIVNADSFDRAKAIAIMRNSLYYWCYEEYLEIFNTVWQFNKSLPPLAVRIRFLQLNKPYNPGRLQSQVDSVRINEAASNFDNTLPGIVEKEVLDKKQKILIYCGLHHALTRFQTPKFFFLKDKGRAGQLLSNKYPGQVYECCLLAPFPPRWFVYNELTNKKKYSYVYPFEGVFNQLYDRLQKPFAIDSRSDLFSKLEDHNSFYAFDTWGGIKLADFCDGVIMLESFDKINPVSVIPDWVTNEAELKAIKDVLPEPESHNVNSVVQMINYIEAEKDLQNIFQLHQIKKFW